MTNELYIALSQRFFFQRMQSKEGYAGSGRDFDGQKSMEINADAYEILELLDKGCSLTQTIQSLAAKYDADPKTIGSAVERVVQSAARIGLATISQARINDRIPMIPPCFASGFACVKERVIRCNE